MRLRISSSSVTIHVKQYSPVVMFFFFLIFRRNLRCL